MTLILILYNCHAELNMTYGKFLILMYVPDDVTTQRHVQKDDCVTPGLTA